MTLLGGDDLETLQRHIKTNWQKRGCPMCENKSWHALVHVTLRIEENAYDTTVVDHRMALPCIAMVCKTCGFTALVNAKVAGIVK